MAIKRILKSLEATHPDLYELPVDHERKLCTAFASFYSRELDYSKTLKIMSVGLSFLQRKPLIDLDCVIE